MESENRKFIVPVSPWNGIEKLPNFHFGRMWNKFMTIHN